MESYTCVEVNSFYNFYITKFKFKYFIFVPNIFIYNLYYIATYVRYSLFYQNNLHLRSIVCGMILINLRTCNVLLCTSIGCGWHHNYIALIGTISRDLVFRCCDFNVLLSCLQWVIGRLGVDQIDQIIL